MLCYWNLYYENITYLEILKVFAPSKRINKWNFVPIAAQLFKIRAFWIAKFLLYNPYKVVRLFFVCIAAQKVKTEYEKS